MITIERTTEDRNYLTNGLIFTLVADIHLLLSISCYRQTMAHSMPSSTVGLRSTQPQAESTPIP